ncbi:MAG: hypothetical protein VZR06_18640, partial [Butyrivibrio sp.]|nr:hypothetical protein [Butyrivibrio sp.]
HRKHLETEIREMLDDAHQRCGLARAGSSRQYYSLDIFHCFRFYVCKDNKYFSNHHTFGAKKYATSLTFPWHKPHVEVNPESWTQLKGSR